MKLAETNTPGIDYRQTELFRNFFLENFPKIVLFARRFLNNYDLATDVAQECFIRLWKGQAEFSSVEKMMGFLYSTARNLSLDHIKHAGVVESHVQQQVKESEVFFHEAIAEEEIYEMIYRAIEQLTPQGRKVILLTLEGKSNAEIAEALDITVNSVRTHKQNSYKKLKSLLQNYFIFLILLYRKADKIKKHTF